MMTRRIYEQIIVNKPSFMTERAEFDVMTLMSAGWKTELKVMKMEI